MYYYLGSKQRNMDGTTIVWSVEGPRNTSNISPPTTQLPIVPPHAISLWLVHIAPKQNIPHFLIGTT